jgi:hypothetical protein
MMERRSISPALITSLVALVVGALVLVYSVPPVLKALLGPGIEGEDPHQRFERLIDSHDAEF